MSQPQFAGLVQQVQAAHAKINQLSKDLGTAGQWIQHYDAELKRMTALLQQLQMSRASDPQIQRVENIPGRRVPFDYLVEIPILAGVTAPQPGTITISQEGPFVATSRVAALRSTFEFQVAEPGSNLRPSFFGRSYGRWRPFHSSWDINDALRAQQAFLAVPGFPGDGSPHVLSPSNEAPFRSMEGDFTIKFVEGSTAYPRSNIAVPSSLWTRQINSPFDLAALDVFERGDVINFEVLPLHANNPPAGNVSGFGAPNVNFPFLDSQWDSVEGIQDPNLAAAENTDPVTRLPNAIFVVGFHGYRIIQPPGAGPY